MSRSNGPAQRPPRWPASHSQPAEQLPGWNEATPGYPVGADQQLPPQHQAHGSQAGFPHAAYPASREPYPGDVHGHQPTYHYPQGHAHEDPYAAAGHVGMPAQQAAAGQGRPYVPPSIESYLPAQPGYGEASPHGGYAQAARHERPQAPGYPPPEHGSPGTQAYSGYAPYDGQQVDRDAHAGEHDPRLQFRGPAYDQWQAPPQNPRGYDLGSYMQPGGGQRQDAARADAGFGADPADWGEQGRYAQGGGDTAHDLSGYGAQAAHPQDYDAQYIGTGLEPTYEHEEADYETEEPPRRRSMMLVVGALVGAVVVGGGLAYAYKLAIGTRTTVATPVVKSSPEPARTKPGDPGGRQFAHTDSKVLGRLSDNSSLSAPTAASGSGSSTDAGSQTDSDGSGARKVTTVIVGRDGTIVPPPPTSAPAAAALPASGDSPRPRPVSVPGLTLVDAFGRPQGAPAPAAREPARVVAPVAPASLPQATPSAAPAKPIVIARATPANTQIDAPEVEAPKPPPAKKLLPVKKPLTTGSASRTSGYVAVLASVPASSRSRLDALRQFADMQQKYATLQNKTPDVQEANLGEKGTYHRLLVGPPGSREQASAVCSDLKTAGYSGCWVMAY